ncbi:Crp/Fnr family transcriptional regulator [Sphingomonas sp. SRS2]|uniref:Crp/Fnr family transcriptional regulator n=1 Tax=Sphingomonas sp. SRS2 TaxID=133190 RepID=UPI0006184BE4|nr:Crp/Fnr family transcriptional regulator [Sphingomonas sp. SRS2]KKC24800.1 hypothetical protein WP12_17575 [Sphingomonas sp. SRS2]
MKINLASAPLVEPAVRRLSALAPLTDYEVSLLQASARQPRRLRPHREIQVELQTRAAPSIVLSGWACHVRTFADGRRQILGLLLPGDVIAFHGERDAPATSTVATLTDVTVCSMPPATGGDGELSALAAAYRRSAALHEAYLFRHIARLGRLNALERMSDWLLELRDRFELAGMVEHDRFAMPLTQEVLADLLGLTSVHVNRTLQTMRREELIDLRSGVLRLLAPDRLALLGSCRQLGEREQLHSFPAGRQGRFDNMR